mgnify:CR=1 FL=1
MRNGLHKIYHSDGTIFEGTYKDDKLHGPFTEYLSNGEIYRKGYCKNGTMFHQNQLVNCYYCDFKKFVTIEKVIELINCNYGWEIDLPFFKNFEIITEGEDEPNFFEGSEYSPLIPRYICDNEKCKEEEEDSSRDLEKEWEEYQNPIID